MPKDSLAAFLDSEDGKEPNLPFAWFYQRFEDQQATPTNVAMVYTKLLNHADLVGHGRSQHADNAPPGAACPHNIILTKRWMIVIPRRRAGINREGGVNAMGMLGHIAVTTQNEISNWIHLGLKETLRELGLPK